MESNEPAHAEAAIEEQARARAAEIEAAKKAASAAADSCAVCGQTWGEDASKDPLWLSCDCCRRWFHGACSGADQDMLDILEEEDTWECHDCWLKRYSLALLLLQAAGRSQTQTLG